MEQLGLFASRNGTDTTLMRTKKRIRRDGRARKGAGQGLDLWNQAPEVEREMALFFLDIRNFTALTEQHEAANVVYIVKKIFSRFQNIIRVYHGRIIETSGDGFYAVFGFDSNIREAVNAAVRAGKAILDTLEKLNEESLEMNLGRRIEVGIGVHAGRVAVGNLHLDAREHFVVMGFPVNVAARLQAATKELNNNFIVSSAVYRVLDNPGPPSDVAIASLKGVSEPCQLHLIGKPYESRIRECVAVFENV